MTLFLTLALGYRSGKLRTGRVTLAALAMALAATGVARVFRLLLQRVLARAAADPLRQLALPPEINRKWFVPIDVLAIKRVSRRFEFAFGGAYGVVRDDPLYRYVVNGRLTFYFRRVARHRLYRGAGAGTCVRYQSRIRSPVHSATSGFVLMWAYSRSR